MGPTQERLASAFKLARDAAFAEREEILEPGAIVMAALDDAMTTLKGLPDPERGWLYAQGYWPQIAHDHEDAIENYKAMLRRIASGEESADVLLPKKRPSAAAVGRMEAIFEVFPKCLVGKMRSRDWKILCFLAMGHPTRRVAALTHTSKGTVSDRRDVQSGQIARKLADLMPAALEPEKMAPQRFTARYDRAA